MFPYNTTSWLTFSANWHLGISTHPFPEFDNQIKVDMPIHTLVH